MPLKAIGEKKDYKKKKHLLSGVTRLSVILTTYSVYLRFNLELCQNSTQFLQKAETPPFGRLRSFW